MLQLADLLEKTAAALREAHKVLSKVQPPSITPISMSGMTHRVKKVLHHLGISHMEELATKTVDDLLEQRGFGLVSLQEVRKFLASVGLHLKGE